MRMDFNVLWVEDQRERVEAQRLKLERTVKTEGFRLQVEFSSSVDEALAKISNDVYSDHIDMILMDYDLGAGKKGDEGLAEIRLQMPYRDIIFYSSQAGDLLQLVATAKLEGIYCSTRSELPDTAQQIFETLVKKVLDIDHSRGIVMGTTTDIDQFIIDCIIASYDGSDDERKNMTLGLIKKRAGEIKKRLDDALEQILASKSIQEALDQHAVYTSHDRLHLLRKLLIADGGHAISVASLLSYVQDIIPKRNLLAHVRVQKEGFSRKLIDKNGNEYTSGHMKQLRLELLSHHESFEGLFSALSAK